MPDSIDDSPSKNDEGRSNGTLTRRRLLRSVMVATSVNPFADEGHLLEAIHDRESNQSRASEESQEEPDLNSRWIVRCHGCGKTRMCTEELEAQFLLATEFGAEGHTPAFIREISVEWTDAKSIKKWMGWAQETDTYDEGGIPKSAVWAKFQAEGVSRVEFEEMWQTLIEESEIDRVKGNDLYRRI